MAVDDSVRPVDRRSTAAQVATFQCAHRWSDVAGRPGEFCEHDWREANGVGRQPGTGPSVPQPRRGKTRREHCGDFPRCRRELGRRTAFLVVPVCPARVDTDDGHSGQPVASCITDGLDDLGLVGDQHLGDEASAGPLPHLRVEPTDVDSWSLPSSSGERDRLSPPPRDPRIDQPTRHEGWPIGMVADRRDQPVVLVAEVGVETRPVAESSIGGDVEREVGDIATSGDHLRPR